METKQRVRVPAGRTPIATKQRVRVPAGSAYSNPNAAYFQNNRNPLMVGWRPQLREHTQDVQASWVDAAARAVESVQNSGFLTKILEVETGSVVGAGLRFSSRPDAEALGWTQEEANKWARQVERAFRSWCDNPVECDAAGKMTFAKMQQAAFASYKTYGEILALMPLIQRPASMTMTKVMLLTPTRLSQKTDLNNDLVQGVKCDRSTGFPISYVITERDPTVIWKEREIAAFDADGRPNVLHVFDSAIGVNRGISPLAPILKIARQVDQFADATLTKALIQTIFAAVMQTNVSGIDAFQGLMTTGDTAQIDLGAFMGQKGEFYDGARIDLTQHGRIAQLFPGDELKFTESKSPGQQYDDFMGWLMREIAAGAGVTYESATGDYRGATYSSIRMAGAIEWLTVMRRRMNIIIPFCQAVFRAWIEEAIMTGRLPFKGGKFAFMAKKEAACRGAWSGPAQPQADDFKAARSHQVLWEMGSTTLAHISDSYGWDWDDDMRQRAEENRLAEELGLPLPHAPTTMLQTKEGQKKELEDPPMDQTPGDSQPPTKKRDSKPSGDQNANARADALNVAIENEIEESIHGD